MCFKKHLSHGCVPKVGCAVHGSEAAAGLHGAESKMALHVQHITAWLTTRWQPMFGAVLTCGSLTCCRYTYATYALICLRPPASQQAPPPPSQMCPSTSLACPTADLGQSSRHLWPQPLHARAYDRWVVIARLTNARERPLQDPMTAYDCVITHIATVRVG